MPRLLSTALSLRRDPRLLKIPPYISAFCIAIGVVWLLLLPLDDYSRRTYVSENALLPGQVHTYFGGSEQSIFRAFRHEVDLLASKNNFEVNDKLESILTGFGVKVGRQNYTYHSAGEIYSGENVYGILQAPRGDATEAIVLVAAWKSIDEQLNRNGVALVLTLARYFKRWSLWSKDIILLLPPDSTTGTQAWVDAYHDAHDSKYIAPLPLKSGALQGALAIDYPFEHRYHELHIIYDGTNGQLPNLDLINSIVNIAGGQMGIETTVQQMAGHTDSYQDRLQTMLRGMLYQGLGYPTGPHSSFIPYHVDAITLQPAGEGWHDEMAMGRVVEGSFRSLNNLLEHLHQSFFFYLLMQKNRFVSIGTYLPSAMLVAANFTIMAIFLWVKSGQPIAKREATDKAKVERNLLSPLALVATCHSISAIPLFIFNHLGIKTLPLAFLLFSVSSTALPAIFSFVIASVQKPTAQFFQLTKSFSLLILGVSLATLSTLNFSLAFLVGLLASPLTFIQPTKNLATSMDQWCYYV
ncbi:gaa1-like, GPI transamidase component domain-containing protein [Trichoderma breve]|uniref:Gaa1-like, GPI transamidase component domain-containing protein n=1 Tax=Trichoderma breve TaxID=2034170 RepID=A0A9W9E7V0_9HYPO|nr:gaa1-like, GPI transamidase component domain-containing protein [Trichoderma breve]KAJ4862248.1 gaa1-like, GPI transamidase component domain-containing protein [Trichoderma breve]